MFERRPRFPSYPPVEVTDFVAQEVLDQCTREREPISGKLGWRAPKGHAFTVTGIFSVSHETSESEMLRPVKSWESFLAENGDTYAECLEEANGDESEALQLMSDYDSYDRDFGPFVHDFQGDWLIEGEEGERPVLMVREAVWAEVREVPHYYQARDELISTIDPLYFEALGHEVYWSQSYVVLEEDKTSVSLTETAMSPTGLYIPEPAKETPLCLPVTGKGITIDDISEYYSCGGSVQWTEEQKLIETRRRRQAGVPVWDDPLRNFILPRIVVPPRQEQFHHGQTAAKEEINDIPF